MTLEEFYGRAMPAGIPIDEAEFVPLSQLYGRFAEVVSEDRAQRFEGEVRSGRRRTSSRRSRAGRVAAPGTACTKPISASTSASARSPT